MVDQLISALQEGKKEEATWLVQAILHSSGVSKIPSSDGSTRGSVPLSAADLPTLLDILLETPTSPVASVDSTLKSKLRSQAKSLHGSNSAGSQSGTASERGQSGSTQPNRPLSSNRKYWPRPAKTVFWDLVRELNAWDKENMKKGERSPIQLDVAEEATRQWWRNA